MVKNVGVPPSGPHLCIQDSQLRGCYQYSTLVMGASTVYKASSSLEIDILCTTILLLSLSTVLKHSFESNVRSSDGQAYQNGRQMSQSRVRWLERNDDVVVQRTVPE